jgi:hypothetical protein
MFVDSLSPVSCAVPACAAALSCSDTCVICQTTYSVGDDLTHLPCLHAFHKDCIAPWLSVSACCAYLQQLHWSQPCGNALSAATCQSGLRLAADLLAVTHCIQHLQLHYVDGSTRSAMQASSVLLLPMKSAFTVHTDVRHHHLHQLAMAWPSPQLCLCCCPGTACRVTAASAPSARLMSAEQLC